MKSSRLLATAVLALAAASAAPAAPALPKPVTTFKDPATRVFTMSLPGPDGKDMTALRITYTRRK